ncbi:aldo/keto reductase [Oceanicola sp. 22II-s10i]|uniref:aldo/keto reductase n=1 Tax=Oceanicola sp. 22II-s10i TaxID=1317116 RepID=UPI000B527BF8|nr:aldo/keto reductase [Oceanicola sp. 22II-s10i]OWU82884.1 aldo/keto reductase [Oceanicola sp. 22II-s10i]
MQTSPLGRTGTSVSRYCLGSMTWGGPTPMREAHQQIDMALDHAITFLDTAEVFPVAPVRAETVGRTERIIGLWFERNGRRGEVTLATKQAGRGLGMVRGEAAITPATIRDALEGCLRRLRTDYIDLYQFHWPNRGAYHNRRNWDYDPAGQSAAAVRQNMADCLGALQDEVRRGTIRHFGLTHESAWGMAQWLALADAGAGPRPVTVQNEYSLLCRAFDTDLAELAVNEDLGLLAFAPLAWGLLTGKYRDGPLPAGARTAVVPTLAGRLTDRARSAADAYVRLAERAGLDPIGMALAWVAGRPFTTSVVFGATTSEQLAHILAQTDLTLTPDVRTAIDALHRDHPMPF